MSRSHKKIPIVTDSAKPYKLQPSPKTIANRIFRSKLKSELKLAEKTDFQNLPPQNRATFKKYYESYNICDFKSALDFSYSPTKLEPYPQDIVRRYYQK